MARRLIGTGITNSQGIAIMDKDPQGNTITGYTGVGAGKLQIIAESGDLTSETYELLDCIFLDLATTGNKNTNWTNPSTAIGVATDSSGTTLTNESGTYHYWANNYTQMNIGAFAIEFDILSYSDSTNASFRLSGNNSHSIVYKTIGCPQQCHLKIMVTGNKIQYQIDDDPVTDFVTTTETQFYCGFRFVGASNVKYKDFKVYPI